VLPHGKKRSALDERVPDLKGRKKGRKKRCPNLDPVRHRKKCLSDANRTIPKPQRGPWGRNA